jgi:DNA-binding PadR family transcriptional regulator
MGRHAEPALWILVALRRGPRTLTGLLDDVRRLDGVVGHGTLLGTIARLEQRALVESVPDGGMRREYRLVEHTMEPLP